MADVIYFFGSCEAYNDTEIENINEVNYALYHGGLIDIGSLGFIEVTCGTADDHKIVTRTQRENTLLSRGILRLIDDVNSARRTLNGGTPETEEALDKYHEELRELLNRITSIEKEE